MARANADHAGAYIDHWNEPTTYRPLSSVFRRSHPAPCGIIDALCCLIIAHTEQAT